MSEIPLRTLLRAAGYDFSQISQTDIDDPDPDNWNKTLKRAAEAKAERAITRRAEREARNRAEWEAEQRLRPPRPQPHKIRLIRRRAAAQVFTCSLCLEIKSHPVKLPCEHSACDACVRLSLETDWNCPIRGTKITKKPIPHEVEAAAIERENPGGDDSKVDYF
ncbi:hypothetical protein B0H14DRAFT_3678067 [Mycena olivaceomarginata]|nr:hypothetical protein B0H14DRAFT_3678067 [Mycena olivaceomarginata]